MPGVAPVRVDLTKRLGDRAAVDRGSVRVETEETLRRPGADGAGGTTLRQVRARGPLSRAGG